MTEYDSGYQSAVEAVADRAHFWRKSRNLCAYLFADYPYFLALLVGGWGQRYVSIIKHLEAVHNRKLKIMCDLPRNEAAFSQEWLKIGNAPHHRKFGFF